MIKEIENIIKKNLPEKVVVPELMKYVEMVEKARINGKYDDMYDNGFNQALSQINTSLIADEVLKVVVEKIKGFEIDIDYPEQWDNTTCGRDIARAKNNLIEDLLSNLSPNKENKNNE